MTGLENPHDSILPEIETALVPINSTAWKTAQHFSYGARVLFARPRERSERLKLFVIKSISSRLSYCFEYVILPLTEFD
jgi:hypothetical protein